MIGDYLNRMLSPRSGTFDRLPGSRSWNLRFPLLSFATAWRELARRLHSLFGGSPCTGGLPLDPLSWFGRPCARENSDHRSDLVVLSASHTSRLHSFGVVFVDFDKEYFKNQDFRQNVSNPARCSAFFMYTLFLLKNKSSWRNIGFTVPK